MAQYHFSTGKLSIAAFGATFDSTHVIGAIQDATFEETGEVREMREATVVTLYPVDNVIYDKSGMFKFSAGDLAEALIPFLTGAGKTTSGGYAVYTGSQTNTAPYVKIKLEGKLSDGRNAILEIDRARGVKGMGLNTKRDDYTTLPAEFGIYPAATTDAPWVLKIQTP